MIHTRVCLAILLALGFAHATGVDAQQFEKSVMTFNEPFAVPGHVFPAGTYTFTLGDRAGGQNIVRIFDQRSTLLASVMSIPEQRPAGPHAVIVFNDATAGSAKTVRVWFYPGADVGHRFVYASPEK